MKTTWMKVIEAVQAIRNVIGTVSTVGSNDFTFETSASKKGRKKKEGKSNPKKKYFPKEVLNVVKASKEHLTFVFKNGFFGIENRQMGMSCLVGKTEDFFEGINFSETIAFNVSSAAILSYEQYPEKFTAGVNRQLFLGKLSWDYCYDPDVSFTRLDLDEEFKKRGNATSSVGLARAAQAYRTFTERKTNDKLLPPYFCDGFMYVMSRLRCFRIYICPPVNERFHFSETVFTGICCFTDLVSIASDYIVSTYMSLKIEPPSDECLLPPMQIFSSSYQDMKLFTCDGPDLMKFLVDNKCDSLDVELSKEKTEVELHFEGGRTRKRCPAINSALSADYSFAISCNYLVKTLKCMPGFTTAYSFGAALILECGGLECAIARIAK